MRNTILTGLLLIAFLSLAQAGSTLDKIRAQKSLACGINAEEPEYTLADAHGNRVAFDTEICKAVAVAALGPGAKFTVKLFPDEASSMAALKSHDVALLATASVNIRTANGSFGFARHILYDYQGLLVNKTMGITSPKDLVGKKVCFLIGTEIETQIDAYMSREKIKYIPAPFSEEGEMEAALVTGNCAAVTADVTQLAAERIAFKRMTDRFTILPDVIAKDPLAPAYMPDDPQWATIVNWTMNVLIEAEELGITQANVNEMRKSNDIVVQRFLGTNRGWGQFLGLDDDFAGNVVETVGNYGEIFDRTEGTNSPMRLERGPNQLWTQGGLMYAEPMR
ncbi:MAG TPA: transporter substrate-binding domain-containing protein [Terriglobales bacterium]|nr:transporter substrate-binding domain-containing protein [Terriglobales bacterium]